MLHAKKTKVVHFTKSQSASTSLTISTLDSPEVPVYKYPGFWIDDKITFKINIEKLAQKLKIKFGFCFRNKACLCCVFHPTRPQ